MSEYKHGSMEITAQEQTFDGFVRLSIRVGGFSVAVLIFLAMFNS